MEKEFDLDVTVNGMGQQEYMAELLARNERKELELDRAKMSVAILKQMNNRSRIMLDAAKFRLKEQVVKTEEKET